MSSSPVLPPPKVSNNARLDIISADINDLQGLVVSLISVLQAGRGPANHPALAPATATRSIDNVPRAPNVTASDAASSSTHRVTTPALLAVAQTAANGFRATSHVPFLATHADSRANSALVARTVTGEAAVIQSRGLGHTPYVASLTGNNTNPILPAPTASEGTQVVQHATALVGGDTVAATVNPLIVEHVMAIAGVDSSATSLAHSVKPPLLLTLKQEKVVGWAASVPSDKIQIQKGAHSQVATLSPSLAAAAARWAAVLQSRKAEGCCVQNKREVVGGACVSTSSTSSITEKYISVQQGCHVSGGNTQVVVETRSTQAAGWLEGLSCIRLESASLPVMFMVYSFLLTLCWLLRSMTFGWWNVFVQALFLVLVVLTFPPIKWIHSRWSKVWIAFSCRRQKRYCTSRLIVEDWSTYNYSANGSNSASTSSSSTSSSDDGSGRVCAAVGQYLVAITPNCVLPSAVEMALYCHASCLPLALSVAGGGYGFVGSNNRFRKPDLRSVSDKFGKSVVITRGIIELLSAYKSTIVAAAELQGRLDVASGGIEMVVSREYLEGLARLALRYSVPMVPGFAFAQHAVEDMRWPDVSCGDKDAVAFANAVKQQAQSAVGLWVSAAAKKVADALKYVRLAVCFSALKAVPLCVVIGSPVPLPVAVVAAAAVSVNSADESQKPNELVPEIAKVGSDSGSSTSNSSSCSGSSSCVAGNGSGGGSDGSNRSGSGSGGGSTGCGEGGLYGQKGQNACDDAVVELYVEQHIAALQALFAKYKKVAGCEHMSLKVVQVSCQE